MAYLIQHRRDTKANWEKYNPVLADGEMGFIKDVDADGNQKSSLYKIGDGKHTWNDLPLFGYNGNVYPDFEGDDLEYSVATRSAVQAGLDQKLNTEQLVQSIEPTEEEQDLIAEDLEEIMKNQTSSRFVINSKFDNVENSIEEVADLTNSLNNEIYGWTETDEETEIRHEGINDKISQINTDLTTQAGEIENIQSDIVEQNTVLDEHSKYLDGWEETNGGETITHAGLVKEIYGDANANINGIVKDIYGDDGILPKVKFMAKMDLRSKTDFESMGSYTENTLYFIYDD